MPTLAEIPALWADDQLRAKVEAAMTVVANEVEGEDPGTANHAGRLALANEVYNSVQRFREPFLRAMVAANSGATAAQIANASDATILAAVRAAWNTFI